MQHRLAEVVQSGARLSWAEPDHVPHAPRGWLTQAELT